ncbi:MAG: mannose-1-phosphate guanylyltransferase [Bacteroidales bacterium]|nr:mannose-1-phosphate guanylyltransferase [Bacteroidales bacterium]
MTKKNFCIIMAGGVGSRFWPLSTTATPKQFLDILGVGKTLLQLTYERMVKIVPPENFYVVTNAQYENIVLQQIPDLQPHQVLKEPLRKNTAPCIAYGNHEIRKRTEDANIIVTPSDHLILNEEDFLNTVTAGWEFTQNNDSLLTLGIKPTRPDTGFGYIQIKEEVSEINSLKINKVKTFTEKPELEIAKMFLKSGDFFWNSGIFLWSLKSIDCAFKTYLPKVYDLFTAEQFVLDDVYSNCPNISIDYGIMEKAENVYVLQSSFGWSDLGTWGALYENAEKDEMQNAVIGENVMTYNTKNCVISMPNNKLAVVDGLENCIVVDTADKLLICKRDDEQKIRQFVNDIKFQKGESYI